VQRTGRLAAGAQLLARARVHRRMRAAAQVAHAEAEALERAARGLGVARLARMRGDRERDLGSLNRKRSAAPLSNSGRACSDLIELRAKYGCSTSPAPASTSPDGSTRHQARGGPIRPARAPRRARRRVSGIAVRSGGSRHAALGERPAIVWSTGAALPDTLRDGEGLSRARLLWLGPVLLLGAVVLGAGIVLAGPLACSGSCSAGWRSCPPDGSSSRRCGPRAPSGAVPPAARTRSRGSTRAPTHGLVCRACGWRDASASAWLLAEEEGPLEEIVLAERGRARARRPRWTAPEAG
jgi:hypothetical protein